MSDNNKKLVRGLHGLFNLASVESINVMDKGVAVTNSESQLIHWIGESDREKALKIADALTDAVMDGKAIDWKALGY